MILLEVTREEMGRVLELARKRAELEHWAVGACEDHNFESFEAPTCKLVVRMSGEV